MILTKSVMKMSFYKIRTRKRNNNLTVNNKDI